MAKVKERRERNQGGRPRRRQPTAWGRKIDSLAADRGMTRADLAREIEITYVALWQQLMGLTKPSIGTLCKLADVLKVSLDVIRPAA